MSAPGFPSSSTSAFDPPRPTRAAPDAKELRRRVWPRPARGAAIVVLGFTLLLYLVELVDAGLLRDWLQWHLGIEPRSVAGLDGILAAPLLHLDWAHLSANTVPLLVLGFLAMAGGARQFVAVTTLVWLVGGIGVWLTAAPSSVTIGASGVVFGWLTFLLVRGFWNRAPMQIVIAIALFLYWGGMLWGVLPGADGVSWQGHLFGAIGGVLAAWLVARASRQAEPAPRVAPLV